jgi:hypothetical protein
MNKSNGKGIEYFEAKGVVVLKMPTIAVLLHCMRALCNMKWLYARKYEINCKKQESVGYMM